MAPAEPGAGKTTVGTLPAVLRRRLANLLDRGVEVCSQEDQQWLCLILFAPADEIVPLPCQLVIRSGQILARAGRFAGEMLGLDQNIETFPIHLVTLDEQIGRASCRERVCQYV